LLATLGVGDSHQLRGLSKISALTGCGDLRCRCAPSYQRTGISRIFRTYLHGHRFAGEHRLVEEHRPLEDASVGWDNAAQSQFNDVVWHKLGGGDFGPLTVPLDERLERELPLSAASAALARPSWKTPRATLKASNVAMMKASIRSPIANCKTIAASSIHGTQNRRPTFMRGEIWGSTTAFGPTSARRRAASSEERPWAGTSVTGHPFAGGRRAIDRRLNGALGRDHAHEPGERRI
jgi:hypothetical protein